MSAVSPPCLIGGSTPSWGFFSEGRFDCYNATVFAHQEQVSGEVALLLQRLGHPVSHFPGGRMRQYTSSRIFVDDKGKQLVVVKWGGVNPHPHVECYGLLASHLAEHLRATLEHRPTRIDHCVDRRGNGLFDTMKRKLLDEGWCRERGLKLELKGDLANPQNGLTLDIGSRESQVCGRIYEKGKEYAGKAGIPLTDELAEVVRFEIEFKPKKKPARAIAPSVTGPQIWGSTRWTADIASEVLSMATEPICIVERRESNRERALRFMGKQYSAHLRALLDKDCQGDLCEFGRAVAQLAGIDDD